MSFLDWLFDVFIRLFRSRDRKEPQITASLGTDYERSLREDQERFKPVKLYHEAEALRKAGHVKESEQKYWESIQKGEEYKDGLNFGPPAAYFELAKLYYHTGFDDKALEVLDRYINLTPNENIEAKSLRERMAKGDFRRLKNKYDIKPAGS